jgi:hypothetical protein
MHCQGRPKLAEKLDARCWWGVFCLFRSARIEHWEICGGDSAALPASPDPPAKSVKESQRKLWEYEGQPNTKFGHPNAESTHRMYRVWPSPTQLALPCFASSFWCKMIQAPGNFATALGFVKRWCCGNVNTSWRMNHRKNKEQHHRSGMSIVRVYIYIYT